MVRVRSHVRRSQMRPSASAPQPGCDAQTPWEVGAGTDDPRPRRRDGLR
jgi:hypothetical protein